MHKHSLDRRLTWCWIVIAASTLILAGCASSVTVSETATATETSTSGTPQSAPHAADATTPSPSEPQCREDTTFRARLVETDPNSGDVATEYRYEVSNNHVREELVGRQGGQAIMQGTEAWTYSASGWVQMPVTPVRPLRTPWVNNFVTGTAVARAAETEEPDEVYGLDVRRIALTYEQFERAFPAKIGDTDYDPEGTSFTYWLDACDQIVKAEIITTFGPETEELMGPDFPLMFSYTYETYDLGDAFPPLEPMEPVVPIPPPAES